VLLDMVFDGLLEVGLDFIRAVVDEFLPQSLATQGRFGLILERTFKRLAILSKDLLDSVGNLVPDIADTLAVLEIGQALGVLLNLTTKASILQSVQT
jgi:hypothetical protein